MKNTILELEIIDLARGGAGVAKEPSGRVVFIPFTAPGDRVQVRVLEEKKHYAHGELIEVLKPSEMRQEAPCKVFTQCGGCQWQHIPYEFQWKTKFNGVQQALAKLKVPVLNWDPLPAEKIWEYRNRIQLRGEAGSLGFYQAGSNVLVPVDRCEIARPELNAAFPKLREEAKVLRGLYKVEVEVLPTGEIHKSWNSRHAAAGFRQVHDAQNEKLKAWVGAAIKPGRTLLDLFGGSGNLSLPLSDRMTEIHCVDLSSPEEKSRPRYTFHHSATLPWLLRYSKKTARFAKGASAILDPPREGLGADFAAIAEALQKLGVDEIVAVGCDTDSWARDVSRFTQRGWKIQRAAALDLFPQTSHVEAIAQLVL